MDPLDGTTRYEYDLDGLTALTDATGREWDPEIGLYYYRARCNDPKIGRFVSSDPAGLEAGANLHAYADGNPVRWTDPLGLAREDPLDEVARNALRAIYRKCQRLSYPMEYRGPICGCNDSKGSHSWYGPADLARDDVEVPNCASGNLVALYHCHPPGDVTAEYFSSDDSFTQHAIHGSVYLIYGNALQKEIGHY